ncbi:MAG TPA: GNAT family N-acetyltransferase [Solirubrobacterales bacterium]|nr:GNAT family N-acetyltransferase [Solirubrobacterales bacterium]
MANPTETDLYGHQLATLLASWEANARGSAGAAVLRLGGVDAAVFPAEPERDIYNNAVLSRGLTPSERAAAIAAMESAYACAGVERFAAWVHDTDGEAQAELSARGYAIAEQTRAMAMALADAELAVDDPPGVEIAAADWAEYLEYLRGFGLPRELLTGVDPHTYTVAVARIDGETVATGLAFDHHGDCGIFNVSTMEPARRRGIGTAVTARLLRDAQARGRETASLQSTPVAENVYAALGFRDLGRFLEHAPPRRG